MTCPIAEPSALLPSHHVHLLCLSLQADSTGPKRALKFWFADLLWGLAQLGCCLRAEAGRS